MPTSGAAQAPVVVFGEGLVRVSAIAVTHDHAVPAFAYRFDTADGSVVFSGDTTANDDLIALATGADVLVHSVADLDYLERHGTTGAAIERMAALHTDVDEVGRVAQRARVGELILNHYLPAEPEAIADTEWAARAGRGFSGRTTAGCDGLRRTLAPRARQGPQGRRAAARRRAAPTPLGALRSPRHGPVASKLPFRPRERWPSG
jgi:ribonuclease BN (tRNA processing enzyme)